MKDKQVSIPIDIADVRVISTEINKQGEVIITLESTKPETKCHKCGRTIRKQHGQDDWVNVRYLPVFGKATYLRYRPKRYQCLECEDKPTTTERVDWHDRRSPNSTAYEEYLLLQLVNSTIEDVSQKEGIGYDQVLGVMERRISEEVEWKKYTELKVIGIDEIAIKKGHRDFVVIVTGRIASGKTVLLGVLKDREKASVVEFLRSIPKKLQETIERVCCDMYEGFSEAVREEIPPAKIVIDRFHVTRHYYAGADEMRKEELRRLKKEKDEATYASLKGSMWAFRKRKEELSGEERQALKRLFELSPGTKKAYELRQQLSDIFNEQIGKGQAKTKIRYWIKRVKKSGLKCFDAFLKTLEKWWEEITNYFIKRENSGFVEGFNNKIKVLKRRCYGIFNLKHLFQRIYLDLEGYQLFK